MTVIEEPGAPIIIPTRDEAKIARRERLRLLFRSPTFVIVLTLLGFWVVCAIFGSHPRTRRPTTFWPSSQRPRATTSSAPTAWGETSSLA